MADGLIAVTQAAGAQHPVAIDDDRVACGAAQSEPRSMHLIHIRLTAERAAVAKFPHKGPIGHIQRLGLMPDGTVGKIDVEIDGQPVGRQQGRGALITFDGHALQHADRAYRTALRLDTGIEDRLDKRRGGAIQNGNFGSVDLDQRIVDATSGQRGHHMFDGGHGDAGFIAQQGAQAGRHNVIPTGGDQLIVARDVSAAEEDTSAARSGTQSQRDRRPGMETKTLQGDGSADRILHGDPLCSEQCVSIVARPVA